VIQSDSEGVEAVVWHRTTPESIENLLSLLWADWHSDQLSVVSDQLSVVSDQLSVNKN
jgi:hypothetical protein